jgi:7,8-didemethyl-8-hydroxy-5-deazariboflavin synthase
MLESHLDPNLQEVLAKNSDGDAISKEHAYELMDGGEASQIAEVARCIRHQTKGRLTTYSRKVFINIINLCRDTCGYCTYKKEPSDRLVSMMTPQQVLLMAETGKKFKCTEALFVSGERPEQRYHQAREWLRSFGHTSTIEYIREMSEMVLQKTGLLPHTNAGSLTKKEMLSLKDTNVSLGTMLEASTERLVTKNMPHEFAPSKHPKVRLRTLEDAGELKIPTTTGLLIGIGESPEELVDSLFQIKEIQEKHGHIQEVIMQNFVPKPETIMGKCMPASHDYFVRSIALARLILPSMNIQVPPNLSPYIFGQYLDSGINDWGGISPVTVDYVNPEFPWPGLDMVKKITVERGYDFRARLPVYPEFFKRNSTFIPYKLQSYVDALSDTEGLVKEEFVNGLEL